MTTTQKTQVLLTPTAGKHTRFPEATLHRAKTISITPETPLKLPGDGKIIREAPISLEVILKDLKEITPCQR